jgi:hypothetical protein
MKNKVVFILLFLIFVSGFVFAIDSEKQIFVNEENKNQENQFYSCIVNEKEDKLILLNKSENYVLTVWLYENKINHGKYQILGSDYQTLLEGFLLQDGINRDLKTTLFIEYTEKTINISGSAQLYKPKSIIKSGEVLDFCFVGNLVK